MTPVIVVADGTVPPFTNPAMEQPWMGSIYVAASAAGSESSVMALNPANSGKWCIVDRVIFAPSADHRVYGRAGSLATFGGALSGAGVTGSYIQSSDLRIIDLPATTLAGSNDDGATVQITIASLDFQFDSATNKPEYFCGPILLDEGDALAFCTNEEDVVLSATFFGRELPKPT